MEKRVQKTLRLFWNPENGKKGQKNRLFSESKNLLLIFKVKPEKSKKGPKNDVFKMTPNIFQKIDPLKILIGNLA